VHAVCLVFVWKLKCLSPLLLALHCCLWSLPWIGSLDCVTAEGVRMVTTRSGARCNAGQTHQDNLSFLFDFQEKYMAVVFNVFVKWWLGRNALPQGEVFFSGVVEFRCAIIFRREAMCLVCRMLGTD
jgi:hypothetical protein